MNRQSTGIGEPPADLSGFTSRQLARGAKYVRAIKAGRGPWWFASASGGRFNLEEPRGTCYLAVDIETGIRERAGAKFLQFGTLTAEFVDDIAVAQLELPTAVHAAATAHVRAVEHGCSREIGTVADYQLTRRWASRFHETGFDAVEYASRFTSGPEANALALFGNAGDGGYPVRRLDTGRQAVAEAGLPGCVTRAPSSKAIPFRQPPSL